MRRPRHTDADGFPTLRHLPAAAALSDTFRLTGPSDLDSPAAAPMTDTFRLTGPSDVE